MTLYHPTLPGVSVTVAKRAVKAWTDQGWRKTRPHVEGVEAPDLFVPDGPGKRLTK